MVTYAEQLSRQTPEADLYRPLDRNRVECFACGHRCPIPPDFAGVCKVRYNRGGKLFAPFGYVNSAFCDPIEKKPFYHALPGTRALSFGMLGCDLHCGYCQNWVSSQALRDYRSTLDFQTATPEFLVNLAISQGATSLISTYNEPLITAEWAVAVFRVARQAGLATGFVSNGNATPEVLDYIRPWTDLYKVDLKSFDAAHYRELGGRIAPVLDSIARIHQLGFWLEVVTLVIPGFNDSNEGCAGTAEFLAAISPDHPAGTSPPSTKTTRLQSPDDTPASTLIRAAEIGRTAGLRYVYAGNLPGETGQWEDTHCPSCGGVLVARRGFHVLRNRMGSDGRCPDCAASIPGISGGPCRVIEEEAGDLVHIRCG